jgi:hypothetical protein
MRPSLLNSAVGAGPSGTLPSMLVTSQRVPASAGMLEPPPEGDAQPASSSTNGAASQPAVAR